MDPSISRVLAPIGADQHPFALCCVDSFERPLSFQMTVSFFDWDGRMALELHQRSPTVHSFQNGMIVFGGWDTPATTHYVARGQSQDLGCFQWSGNCSTQCVSDSEFHAVRCCSDSAKEGWNNSYCPDVWQNLDEWQHCLELPYQDAVAFCASEGARLCTQHELQRDCAKQPSCSFDQRLVWTDESCGTTIDCSDDVQPAIQEENPTCITQKANTDKCKRRAEGSLTDGLCAKTCQSCGGCEDVPGFLDEFAGVGPWGGTCAEWAATGSACDSAAEDWGYTQQGEADILANCRRSCGTCREESSVFFIQNVTPDGNGYRIRANNSLSFVICLYVESNRPAVGDLWMSVMTRSEIYSYKWHESYSCDEGLGSSELGGCDVGSVWPNDWYNNYVALMNGSINNTASNPISSSWRTSTAHLIRHGVKDRVDNSALVIGPAPDRISTTIVEILLTAFCIVASGLLGLLFILVLCRRRCAQKARDSNAKGQDLEHEESERGEPGLSKSYDSFISSFTASDSSDLATANISDIVNLGLKEHWLILPQDLTIAQGAIGHGTFGEVCCGRLYGATPVAVKVARKRLTSRASGRATMALANELALLRRVRHPSIVLFHGSTVLKKGEHLALCLVLEWVEGSDLHVYLKERKGDGSLLQDCLQIAGDYDKSAQTLPEQRLLVDTSVAMQYLHSQHPPIVHRDLKPSNILVDKTGFPHRAKIGDFGLSAILSSEELSGRVGTSAYMAPEVKNRQTYDTSADVYSFGCVLKDVLRVGVEAVAASDDAGTSHSSDTKKQEAKVEAALMLFRVLANQCCEDDPSKRPAFIGVLETLTGTILDSKHDDSLQDTSAGLSSKALSTITSVSTISAVTSCKTRSTLGSGIVVAKPCTRFMSL